MYRAWKIARWDTPFSDVPSLVMVKLADAGGLSMVLEAPRSADRSRWRIEFGRCPAYRNIMEEYRLGLWEHLHDSNQHCGSSFFVENSPWIAEFHQSEPLLEVHAGEVKHFVVVTKVFEKLAHELRPRRWWERLWRR